MTLADLTEPTTQAASSIGIVPMLVATGIVACGAVLVVWLLRSIRPTALRVHPEARKTPVERWHRSDHHADSVKASLERLLHDTESITRLAAQAIDERTRHLEALLQAADQRIAELERQLHAHPDHSRLHPPEVHVRYAESPRDSLVEEIYRLADEGRSAVDIARQLEEHTGKVELILALRMSRQAPRPPSSARQAGSAASA
jgi:hypothetical protein